VSGNEEWRGKAGFEDSDSKPFRPRCFRLAEWQVFHFHKGLSTGFFLDNQPINARERVAVSKSIQLNVGFIFTFVTSFYQNNTLMESNEYLFLKARIKAVNPTWSEADVENEVKRQVSGAGQLEDADDGCLYCGS
jgi:hypothetical protein